MTLLSCHPHLHTEIAPYKLKNDRKAHSFFHAKAADVPAADPPDQLNNLQLRPRRTATLTPKRCPGLTLQQINAMLHYKILPCGHSKVLRTISKTIHEIQHQRAGGGKLSTRTAPHRCRSGRLGSTHHATRHLGLDSFSNSVPVDKVSPRKGFFLVLTVQCQ